MNVKKITDKKYQFCVLMPVHQREEVLKIFDESINSIFSNTIIPNQFVLIIDGPISINFIKKINFYKLKYKLDVLWLKKKSFSLAGPLNEGLKKVKTNYVARADADDICAPNRFEEQISFAKKGYELIGSDIEEVDSNKKKLAYKKMPENFYDIKKYIKMRNPFNHMTIFFKKDLALKYGGYPDLFSKEDYGLWAFFVAHKRKVINLNKPLVKATTDENFYNVRRGGWKYLKSEFNLAKHLLSLKINNIYESIFFLLIRVIFILTFPKLKKILYLKLLRSNNISKI